MDSEYSMRLTDARRAAAGAHGEPAATAASSSTRRWRCAGASSRPAPLLRYPLHDLRVVAGIYAQALRLKLKGAPYHPRPAR